MCWCCVFAGRGFGTVWDARDVAADAGLQEPDAASSCIRVVIVLGFMADCIFASGRL